MFTQEIADELVFIRASLRLLQQVVEPSTATGSSINDGLEQISVRLDRLLHKLNLQHLCLKRAIGLEKAKLLGSSD
jgi:hypothetical protein